MVWAFKTKGRKPKKVIIQFSLGTYSETIFKPSADKPAGAGCYAGRPSTTAKKPTLNPKPPYNL